MHTNSAISMASANGTFPTSSRRYVMSVVGGILLQKSFWGDE